MTNTATFLVELGTEELPPKSLRALAEAFAQNLQANITQAELGFEQIKWFASPRRLAVQITSLSLKQPDRQIEKRGPAIAQAFNADGQATPAAIGWAKGCGITVEEADRIKTDKGEWLIHYANVQGAKTIELISDMVKQALAKLPIPKLMRWGDKETQFVRPVHTLTMLLDSELVEGEMLGLSSGRTVRGHRFMGEAEFELDHAEHYVEQLLSRGKVMVDYEQRKAKIKQDAMHAAEQIGGIADISESLLEEVTSLVEWPVVLTAKFEEKFLAVPSEALVHTMKGDQKYFPVYQKSSAIESTGSTEPASSQFGQLMPNFIFVTNIESKDSSQIISGNEKVVRPRLSDAEFFFNTDRKEKLIDRLPRLANVLFQQQLGTLFDRTQRIADLSKGIAELIGANPEHAHRAGLLAKCDLLTNMVFEFTETQGVMGMHYARFDGEPEDVAVAINEQYQPRFSGDALPQSLVACSVAIAEKMDTLVGIFGIGQHPKGDKDPFALRRAALGVLRIIVEKQLPLDLTVLAQKAADSYGDKLTNPNTVEEVVDFMLGRFRTWYQDAGFAVDTIHAVLARRPTSPVDFDQRMKAVTHFRTLDAAATLAAANKRVSNILAKVESPITDEPQASLYKAGEELRLATHIVVLKEALEPLFAENNYQEALTQLAELRQNVDEFFDNVMVMDDDLAIRANRLSLLNQLRNLFLRVADISLLQ